MEFTLRRRRCFNNCDERIPIQPFAEIVWHCCWSICGSPFRDAGMFFVELIPALTSEWSKLHIKAFGVDDPNSCK